MATVKALLRTSKKSDQKANIRFRLSISKNTQYYHTSELIARIGDWDKTRQCISAKSLMETNNKTEINNSITDRKSLIIDIYNNFLNKEGFSSEILNNLILSNLRKAESAIEPNISNSLFQYLKRFIENAPKRKDKKTGRSLSINNIQQYKATEKILYAFAESIRKNDFLFSEINEQFYYSLVDFLQKPIPSLDEKGLLKFNKKGEQIFIKKGFTQNTVGKHIRILKLMLNEAPASFVENSDYKKFHVFTEDVDNVYLNEDELQLIKAVDLSESPYLDRVRDWFLLLAWTGCRFSDLTKIRKNDIKNGFITFRQQKTNNKVTVPIHPVVEDVLNKYNFIMPDPVSNQKFNDYIKEVVKAAKIIENETVTRTIGGKLISTVSPKYKLVSSHTGRRSFCTNMYLRELPIYMIMSISGHKSEKSFLKYIKVKQEEHAQILANAWKKIYQ